MRRGIRVWVRRSLDDTPPSDDVIPPLAKVPLLGRWASSLSFRSGRLACGDALSAAPGACFARAAFASFHFTQPR